MPEDSNTDTKTGGTQTSHEQVDDDIQLIPQDVDFEVMTISDSDDNEEADGEDTDKKTSEKSVSEKTVRRELLKDAQSKVSCDDKPHNGRKEIGEKDEVEDADLNLKLDLSDKECSSPVKISNSVKTSNQRKQDTFTNDASEDIEIIDGKDNGRTVANNGEVPIHEDNIKKDCGRY